MDNQEQVELLSVAVEDNSVVIRLPFSALQHAVETCPDLEEVDDEGEFAPPIVTDLPKFAADVARELQREEEDGTTPVHRLFDAAFVAAIESGSDAIEILGTKDYDEAKTRRAKYGTAIAAGEG